MDRKRNYCHPIIVNQDILSTSDFEFMNKERIKNECDCIHKSTCIRIFELLSSGDYEQGKNFIETIHLTEKQD